MELERKPVKAAKCCKANPAKAARLAATADRVLLDAIDRADQVELPAAVVRLKPLKAKARELALVIPKDNRRPPRPRSMLGFLVPPAG